MISTIKLFIIERAYRRKNELDMNDKYSGNLNTGAEHSNNGNIRLTKIVQLQLKNIFNDANHIWKQAPKQPKNCLYLFGQKSYKKHFLNPSQLNISYKNNKVKVLSNLSDPCLV